MLIAIASTWPRSIIFPFCQRKPCVPLAFVSLSPNHLAVVVDRTGNARSPAKRAQVGYLPVLPKPSTRLLPRTRVVVLAQNAFVPMTWPRLLMPLASLNPESAEPKRSFIFPFSQRNAASRRKNECALTTRPLPSIASATPQSAYPVRTATVAARRTAGRRSHRRQPSTTWPRLFIARTVKLAPRPPEVLPTTIARLAWPRRAARPGDSQRHGHEHTSKDLSTGAISAQTSATWRLLSGGRHRVQQVACSRAAAAPSGRHRPPRNPLGGR